MIDNLKKYIISFLMGFLVFSSFSSYFILNILHLPFSLPELLLIPLLFLARKYVFPLKYDKRSLLKFSYILMILVIIALLDGRFRFLSIVSALRGYFYLILFFCIFKENNQHIRNEFLSYMSLGSLFGWAFVSLFNVRNVLLVSSDDASVAISGTMMAIPLFLSLSFKNKYLLILGIILLLIISVTAGIRRQILVFSISLLWIFLLTPKNIKTIKLLFSISISILFFFLFFINKIKEFFYDNFYILYVRVFGRIESYLDGSVDSSDSGRLDTILDIFDQLDKLIIPHGIVVLQSDRYENVGIYNDYPLLLLCYMLGFIFVIPILIWLVNILIKNYRLYRRYKLIEYNSAALWIFISIILLFVEATYIYSPYSVPVTGICLGRACFYSKKKNVNKLLINNC